MNTQGLRRKTPNASPIRRSTPLGQPLLTTLFWIYCISLAFDFRAPGGGGITPGHAIILAGTVGSAAGILALGWMYALQKPTGYFTIFWALYLVSTAVAASINGIEPGTYIKTALPVYFIFTGMVVVSAMVGMGYSAVEIVRPILVSLFISSIWRYAYYRFIIGGDVAAMRNEIISPGMPALIAYAAAMIVLHPRLQWHALVALGLALWIITVSVTRTYLLTVAISFAGAGSLALVAVLNRYWSEEVLRRKITQAGLAVGCGLAVVAAIAVLMPVVVDRWAERLDSKRGGNMTKDLTILTREAELKTIVNMVSEDPAYHILGRGIGVSYNWHHDYFPELALAFGSVAEVWRTGVANDYIFPGHSTWTYAYLSGGAIGVASHLALFGCPVFFVGLLCIRKLRSITPETFAIAALPCIFILSAFSQTLTENPLRERPGGLYFGLMIALPQLFFTATHARSVRSQARTRAKQRRLQQTLAASIAEMPVVHRS
ncbi:MAG: hypothetical protein R3F19_29590 [Verrucomicrobiales bacterium]